MQIQNISEQVKVFVFFLLVYLFFTNLAFGAMFSLIFVSNFCRKKYINYPTIFLISIFWDIYSSAFVGISCVTFAIFYFLTHKCKLAFQNFKINIGYLFLFLCCSKLLMFILINFLGYNYDILSHCTQISWSLLIYAVYYFTCVAVKDIYDV
jgi:hypothetical protein